MRTISESFRLRLAPECEPAEVMLEVKASPIACSFCCGLDELSTVLNAVVLQLSDATGSWIILKERSGHVLFRGADSMGNGFSGKLDVSEFADWIARMRNEAHQGS